MLKWRPRLAKHKSSVSHTGQGWTDNLKKMAGGVPQTGMVGTPWGEVCSTANGVRCILQL